MWKIQWFVFVLLALPVWAEEETAPIVVCTVRGVVLDETGAPLPGASVWVKGSTIGAGTNAKGEFVIALRESGRKVLRVSFVGYKTQEYTWNGDESKSVTIRLQKASNSMDEVVVTGTRTPKPLKDSCADSCDFAAGD